MIIFTEQNEEDKMGKVLKFAPKTIIDFSAEKNVQMYIFLMKYT